MVIILGLLTSCDIMGLSKLWHPIWSALLQSTTMARPLYYVYICLSVIPFSIYFERKSMQKIHHKIGPWSRFLRKFHSNITI